MHILGFGHRKRVGKDTAAKFCLSHLSQNYSKIKTGRISFGDQLKDVSYKMFAWGGLRPCTHYLNHPDEIEKILPAIGKSPRQIWDHIGMIGRDIHPKVWVEMAGHEADGDLLVSPDVRFPTEIDFIEMFKGSANRIDRSGAPKVDTPVDVALASYDGWHHVIANDGNLKEFHNNVVGILEHNLKLWFPNGQ